MLDRSMWGTDQSASLEINAMDLLKKRLKDTSKMLGTREKIITDSEQEVLNKLRG